jgi:hypothetical protein
MGTCPPELLGAEGCELRPLLSQFAFSKAAIEHLKGTTYRPRSFYMADSSDRRVEM